MTKLVIAGAVLVWALAVLNAVMYAIYGEAISLLAFFWCAAMATWTTFNALRMIDIERNDRR